MKWTIEFPTEPGHYWWKDDSIVEEAGVVKVTDYNGTLYVEVIGDQFRIKAWRGWWYGPIDPPKNNPQEITPEIRAARLAGYDGTQCPHCNGFKVTSEHFPGFDCWTCEDCMPRDHP